MYSSFEEARRAAPGEQPLGYDHVEMSRYYRELLAGPKAKDYPALFWLRDALPGTNSLFDFGGHVGIAYHAFHRYLDFPKDFTWQVCELPTIAQAGEALARERGATHLRFTVDQETVKDAGIIFASGSLQYMEPGFLHRLIERSGTSASHVIVHSTPLHPERSFITLQATGHAFCPYSVESRVQFVSGLERLGYRLVDEWHIPRELIVPFHDGYDIDHYSGLYFRKS